jgi:flagellar motility protein MotE (MotC chaperone)
MNWLIALPLAALVIQNLEAQEAAPAAAPAQGSFPEKEVYTRAEVEALKSVLVKKSVELDQDIETEKKYVESLKQQVSEHLVKVEAARNQIAEFMSQKDQREEAKLKKLAKFYESMDAEQAAPLLKDVPDDMAIKILDRMDTKKAGSVLALIPASRAAKLTQGFARLKISADKAPSGGSN